MEVFASPGHAQVLIDAWRAFYNGIRPHSSLGNRKPDGFTALHTATQAATTSVHSPWNESFISFVHKAGPSHGYPPFQRGSDNPTF